MIGIKDMVFGYRDGGFRLHVPELSIAAGEKVAFIGPSGSGKTTLVYLIAGILKPEAGDIRVGDFALAGRSDQEVRDFRISSIGFVFQEFELLEYLTTTENVLMPYLVNKSLKLDAAVRESAERLLDSVGLRDMRDRKPGQLSHGERQRVAICRALITQPKIIMADEPTGNLDPENATSVMRLLTERVSSLGTTLIAVTHDHSLLNVFDRTMDMRELTAGGSR